MSNRPNLRLLGQGTHSPQERQRIYIEEGLALLLAADSRVDTVQERIAEVIGKVNAIRGNVGRYNDELDAFAQAVANELTEIQGLTRSVHGLLAAGWGAGEEADTIRLFAQARGEPVGGGT